MSKSWDSAILKKLKSLVGKGLSTAEIGKRLGMSKNAIVGKLHRLGWNTKAIESAPESKKSDKKAATADKKTASKKPVVKAVKPVKTATKAAPTDKKAKTSKLAAPIEKVEPVKKSGGGYAIAAKNSGVHQRAVRHALEMANLKPCQCRWPIGDPDSEGFHFCGAQVFVGKPYCYEHCKQAYQFLPPKKK